MDTSQDTIESLRQATVEKPQDADAFLALGILCTESEKHEEALEALLRALELDPGLIEPRYYLVMVYNKLSRFDDAMKSFLEIGQVKAERLTKLREAGIYSADVGDAGKAEESFREMLRIEPDSYEAYYNLGCLCEKTGRQEEAIESFRQAVGLCPESSDCREKLGFALSVKREFAEAVQVLLTAAELGTGSAEIYFHLGIGYYHLAMHDEAKSSFKKVLKLEPQGQLIPQTLHFIALCLLYDRDRDGAIDLYKKIKKLDPKLSEELYREIYIHNDPENK